MITMLMTKYKKYWKLTSGDLKRVARNAMQLTKIQRVAGKQKRINKNKMLFPITVNMMKRTLISSEKLRVIAIRKCIRISQS